MQQLRETARDWKAESSSVLELRFAELHELMEDALLIFSRDSLALIDDFDRHAALRTRGDAHVNRLRLSKLDGVREEVEQ
ncbi:MAG TPA: hypothetical protein VGL13_03445, partial [Polyangiaceae bacterium]